MNTVTVPKKEYKELLETKLRYSHLREVLEEDIFSAPPTHKKHDVMSAFKASKKYNTRFLKSLENGLERSSHFRS